MHITVRVRTFLARHRWVHWAIVASFALTIGGLVHAQLRSIEAARNDWGETRSVLVATTDLVPDGRIDVAARSLPLALVPIDALARLPEGARLHQRVMAGETLTTADITARDGPAGHADPGTSVVGLSDPLARNSVIGLAVQITSDGVVLADVATIVDVIDEVVFVAVPANAAPMVAAAAQAGRASLVYLP